MATALPRALQADGEEKQQLLWFLKEARGAGRAERAKTQRNGAGPERARSPHRPACGHGRGRRWRSLRARPTTRPRTRCHTAQGALYEANARGQPPGSRDPLRGGFAQPRAGADRRRDQLQQQSRGMDQPARAVPPNRLAQAEDDLAAAGPARTEEARAAAAKTPRPACPRWNRRVREAAVRPRTRCAPASWPASSRTLTLRSPRPQRRRRSLTCRCWSSASERLSAGTARSSTRPGPRSAWKQLARRTARAGEDAMLEEAQEAMLMDTLEGRVPDAWTPSAAAPRPRVQSDAAAIWRAWKPACPRCASCRKTCRRGGRVQPWLAQP